MPLSYPFLDVAADQPDLTDVITYLNKPLHTLEELCSRCEKMALEQQVTLDSLDSIEVYREAQRIVNHYLPKLVNQYCEFSFKYRNTVKIKEIVHNGTTLSYTAKELLLIDIAKVIQQIDILEDKFNDGHKFDFFVNNRIISNLGAQPNILGTIPQANNLENQFQYEKFVSTEIFTKKADVSRIPQFTQDYVAAPIHHDKVTTDNNVNKTRGLWFSSVELGIVIAFIAFCTPVIMHFYNLVKDKEYTAHLTAKTSTLIFFSENFYRTEGTKTVSQASINTIKERYFNNDIRDNSNISMESATINTENDSYKIKVTTPSPKTCLTLLSTIMFDVDKTQVNGVEVEKGNIIGGTTACDVEDPTIEFTKKIF